MPRPWPRIWKPPRTNRAPVQLAAAALLLTAAALHLRRSSPPPHAPQNAIDILPFAANIIVSEPARLIFCPVPKAANSNWKYLIRKWEHNPSYTDLPSSHTPLHSNLRYLSDYSAPEAAALLADPTYFRFLFVRDPYTRLLSAYMDKFRNLAAPYVATEYRIFLAHLFSWAHARATDVERDPRPSFRAFVDELTKHAPSEMDPHWRPQTVLCGIGVVPYDFIGRMEHLKRDVQHVFNKLGRPYEQFPTQTDIGFPPSGASAQVADALYTVDLMFKVRVVYYEDFHQLGYV